MATSVQGTTALALVADWNYGRDVSESLPNIGFARQASNVHRRNTYERVHRQEELPAHVGVAAVVNEAGVVAGTSVAARRAKEGERWASEPGRVAHAAVSTVGAEEGAEERPIAGEHICCRGQRTVGARGKKILHQVFISEHKKEELTRKRGRKWVREAGRCDVWRGRQGGGANFLLLPAEGE